MEADQKYTIAKITKNRSIIVLGVAIGSLLNTKFPDASKNCTHSYNLNHEDLYAISCDAEPFDPNNYI